VTAGVGATSSGRQGHRCAVACVYQGDQGNACYLFKQELAREHRRGKESIRSRLGTLVLRGRGTLRFVVTAMNERCRNFSQRLHSTKLGGSNDD
jgi:hypothetical protein